jgi:hypothetical protein
MTHKNTYLWKFIPRGRFQKWGRDNEEYQKMKAEKALKIQEREKQWADLRRMLERERRKLIRDFLLVIMMIILVFIIIA